MAYIPWEQTIGMVVRGTVVLVAQCADDDAGIRHAKGGRPETM